MFDKLRQAHLHAHDWQEESLTFVPLRGTWFAQSEHSFDLEEEITQFLSGDKKVLLLLGDSGSGKSLYTQGLASKLWSNHKADSPVPVWISLPSLKNPVNRAIEETFEKFGFNAEQITSLKQTHSFIFILDAFDEIHQLKNLWVSNHLDQWKAKIIITCRREYLYHVDNYKHFFTPFNGEKALYLEYDEMIIKPFSEEQIEQYFKQYIQHQRPEWLLEQYQKAIAEMPGLKDLIKTPFLLKLALEALPKMPQDKEQKFMTQAKLYDVFIEQWFVRQEQKLKLAKKIKEEDIKPEFWDYAKRLAQLMHQQKITQVTYDSSQASDLFGENEDNLWQKFFNPENPRIELLRTACLVREVGLHQYAFVHNSLLEYFLTRDLYENLLSKQQEVKIVKEAPKSPQLEDKKPEDYFNERLLVEESNTLQFLADRIDEDETFKKTLFDRVYISKKNPQASIQASNALTILNRARVSFSGMDLSEIQIPDADLSDGILDRVNLSGANLARVKAQRVWLRNADATSTNISEVDFGELPYIDTSTRISSCFYSRSLDLIAVASANQVSVYDFNNNVLVKTFTVGSDKKREIDQVALHPQKLILASLTSNETIIRMWDITTESSLHTLDHTHLGSKFKVIDFAFSLFGNYFIVLGNDAVYIWNMDTAKIINQITSINSITLTSKLLFPDVLSEELIGVRLGDETKVWELKSGNYRESLKIGSAAAFHPNGKVAAFRDHSRIVIKSLVSGEILKKLPGHTASITHITFSSDGKKLASSSEDKTIRMWDVNSGTCLNVFSGHLDRVIRVDFVNNDQLLLSVGDSTIRKWKANSVAVSNMEIGDFGKVIEFDVDDQNGRLISSGVDGTFRIIDLNSGKQLNIIDIKNTKRVNSWNPVVSSIASSNFSKVSFAMNHQGDLLVFTDKEGKLIHEYDLVNGKLYKTHRYKLDITDCIKEIKLHPDGKKIFIRTEHSSKITLWNAETNEIENIFEGYSKKKIVYFGVDKQGKKIISGHIDKTIIIWDVASTKSIITLENKGRLRSACFNNSGTSVIVVAQNDSINPDKPFSIELIDTKTGACQFFILSERLIENVCFGFDEKVILGVDKRNDPPFEVLIWDIKSAKNLSSLNLPSEVNNMILSKQNGLTLLTASFRNFVGCFHVQLSDEHIDYTLLWLNTLTGRFLSCHNLKITSTSNISHENKKLLLQRGAMDMEQTLFFQAIRSKDYLNLSKVLGNDPELVFRRNVKCRTGLHEAAFLGDEKICALLLDHGAKIEDKLPLPWLMTPLHIAVISDFLGVTELLLKRGANCYAETNVRGETALHIAVSKGHELIVKLLLAQGVTFPATEGLYLASNNGDDSLAKLFLERGGKPLSDNVNDSPLYAAVKNKHESIVKLLLFWHEKSQGEKSLLNHKYMTILIGAFKNGVDAIIEALLEKAFSVNIKDDKTGKTILQHAACYKEISPEKISILLNKGAEIDVQDNDGFTPLCRAVEHAGEGLIQLLLQNRANPNIMSKEGTPLHLAFLREYLNVVNLLKIFSLLFKHGADPNMIIPQTHTHERYRGLTLLYVVIDWPLDDVRNEATRILLENAADPNFQESKSGNTCLHLIAHWRDTNEHLPARDYAQLTKLLLDHGADTDITNAEGLTPYELALKRNNKHIAEIIEKYKAIPKLSVTPSFWSSPQEQVPAQPLPPTKDTESQSFTF